MFNFNQEEQNLMEQARHQEEQNLMADQVRLQEEQNLIIIIICSKHYHN